MQPVSDELMFPVDHPMEKLSAPHLEQVKKSSESFISNQLLKEDIVEVVEKLKVRSGDVGEVNLGSVYATDQSLKGRSLEVKSESRPRTRTPAHCYMLCKEKIGRQSWMECKLCGTHWKRKM